MKKYLSIGLVLTLILTPSFKNVSAASKHKVVDKDKNGIADTWQKKYHLGKGKSVSKNDSDHDGLSNLVEYQLNLNPLSKDSDHDGIKDGNEDYDHDGLKNIQEVKAKLKANSKDSDHDGITDPNEDNDHDGLTTKQEFIIGDNPVSSDSDHNGTIDGQEDKDHDGLTNETEFEFHSNPSNADSDHDGIKDGKEDKDHDGVKDGEQMVEMHFTITTNDNKKLTVQYEFAGGKKKYHIKDGIGIENVKEKVEQLTFTTDMTNDQAVNLIKDTFPMDNLKQIKFEMEFGGGKHKNGEHDDEATNDGGDNNGDNGGEND
jgi:hypothetical protein